MKTSPRAPALSLSEPSLMATVLAVTLHAYGDGDRVSIDVEDNCGGLTSGFAEKMFKPFTQGSVDRSGLGLGLSIAGEPSKPTAGA